MNNVFDWMMDNNLEEVDVLQFPAQSGENKGQMMALLVKPGSQKGDGSPSLPISSKRWAEICSLPENKRPQAVLDSRVWETERGYMAVRSSNIVAFSIKL